MSRLALFTFGILVAPYMSNEVAGLFARGDEALVAARTTDGFLGVAEVVNFDPNKTPWEQDWGDWGKLKAPRFYPGPMTNEGRIMQTLSVWANLEGASQFAYAGPHAEVLSKRKEWFLKADWPTYTLWWVEAEQTPTWQEGCERLEYLHDNGSSSVAFNFKHPFDQQGEPIQLKRQSSRSTS